MIPTTSRWTVELITATKRSVKAQVHAKRDSVPPEEFVQFMLNWISESSANKSHLSRLESLVLIISLLINCRDSSLIPLKTVKNLERVANAILRIQRVSPHLSKLSSIFGDLYSAFGRYFRNVGEHEMAIWYQGLANRIERGREGVNTDYHSLLSGNRLFRIGLVPQALLTYQAAIDKNPDSKFIDHYHLNAGKALRLQRRFDEAVVHFDQVKGVNPDEQYLVDDAKLEREYLAIQQTHSTVALLAAYQTKEDLQRPEVALNGCLWNLVCTSITDHSAWYKILIAHKKAFKNSGSTISFEVADTLHKFYQTPLKKNPLEDRIHLVGMLLGRAKSAISLERELLILLAIARWLHRNRDEDLKFIVFSRYEQMSRGISEGRSSDILGLGAEIMTNRSHS